LTAKLGRVEDFPHFEDVIAPLEGVTKGDEAQTPEEMYAIIKSFDATLKRQRGE